jgi:hypothetical protein
LEFWQNHPEEILFHRWSREGLEWFLSLLSEGCAGIWQSPGREPGTICFEGDQNIREISV